MKNLNRREFFKKTAAGIAGAGLAAAGAEYKFKIISNAGRRMVEWINEIEKERFEKQVEKTTALLKQQISENIQTCLNSETDNFREFGLKATVPFARKLLKDNQALENLARVVVMYNKKKHFSMSKFTYNPRDAAAYLKLKDSDPDQLLTKIQDILRYDSTKPWNADLMCALLDKDFNFNLKAEELAELLKKGHPQWKILTPDVESIEKLNIYERNRLKNVVAALNNKSVIADIFREAQADISSITEFGGLIDFSSNSKQLIPIAPAQTGDNFKYVPPPKLDALMSSTAAFYHFHPTISGPSKNDKIFLKHYHTLGILFEIDGKRRASKSYALMLDVWNKSMGMEELTKMIKEQRRVKELKISCFTYPNPWIDKKSITIPLGYLTNP